MREDWIHQLIITTYIVMHLIDILSSHIDRTIYSLHHFLLQNISESIDDELIFNWKVKPYREKKYSLYA